MRKLKIKSIMYVYMSIFMKDSWKEESRNFLYIHKASRFNAQIALQHKFPFSSSLWMAANGWDWTNQRVEWKNLYLRPNNRLYVANLKKFTSNTLMCVCFFFLVISAWIFVDWERRWKGILSFFYWNHMQ